MYTKILKKEMIPAFGCTEPIALALAGAKAKYLLGKEPDNIIVHCSGNIIKNTKSVLVPGTDGKKGIEISVILGAIAGDHRKDLEVLSGIDKSLVDKAERLVEAGICQVKLAPNIPGLYIKVEAFAKNDSASVTIKDSHTNIIEIIKNGEILLKKEVDFVSEENESVEMTFDSIYEYATTTDLEEIIPVLDMQIEYNMAIAREGLKGEWGSNIGSTLLKTNPDNKLAAYAAAASDARMSGCEMPVVINSGSGNQGITVSVPIIVYAEENKVPKEAMYRALILSNLIGIYIKQGIGKLSAYCGAVSAAAGSAAGIAYLKGSPKKVIEETVSNALATSSGILCDGAKASCASKIAIAVATGLMAYELSVAGKSFNKGDGIVKENIDETINSVTQIAKDGMRDTDITILNEMIKKSN